MHKLPKRFSGLPKMMGDRPQAGLPRMQQPTAAPGWNPTHTGEEMPGMGLGDFFQRFRQGLDDKSEGTEGRDDYYIPPNMHGFEKFFPIFGRRKRRKY